MNQREAGKALRDRVSRESHAQLHLASGRDPLGILQESDAERLPELVPIRYGRMMQSPFSFFRGAAAIMAADLAQTTSTGATVQLCGDCHLKNFGGFATPERNVVFDINDFDETLPGPWEWDVKRLAASFVLAVRSNGLSEDVARDVTLTCVRSYRKHMRELAGAGPLDVWYTKLTADDFLKLLDDEDRERVRQRINKASSKRGSAVDYPKLTETVRGDVRIKESPPLIFHPEVSKQADFLPTVDAILKEYRESLPEDRRELLDRYHFVDAAIKVVGVGSVGKRCWIALLMSEANEPLFLQFKQAGPSALEAFVGKSQYANWGQRVVMGQRIMQAASDIFLGWTTGPAGDFYVRQLRDAKIGPNVETFNERMFLAFAGACGWNLARAHARKGNAGTLAGYLGKNDVFDEAVADFAKAYADQTERDHEELKAAVRAGKIEIFAE
ncbi:MAG: DUF2252 domain-containing protein [Candidatus Eremiobacteraeota bacterium]|nr:DUF2252 domain-containing protein [Candidatus Eremiobacteraeota bacterium]